MDNKTDGVKHLSTPLPRRSILFRLVPQNTNYPLTMKSQLSDHFQQNCLAIMCSLVLRVIVFLVTFPFLITIIPTYVILILLYILLIRLPLYSLCSPNIKYTNEHNELIQGIPHIQSPRDIFKNSIVCILETRFCHYYLSFVFHLKTATKLVRIRKRFENGTHDDVISNQSNVKVFGGNNIDHFHQFIHSVTDGVESELSESSESIEITFTSMDSISAAISEFESNANSDTICILDLASRRHVGGSGFAPIGSAQEESLIRHSDLYWRLHPKYNKHLKTQLMEKEIDDSHTPYFGTVYIPNVIFLNEDVEYRFDVVASAAPDVRPHSNEYTSFWGEAVDEERRRLITRKLEAVVASCIACNAKVLIAGAFGCGVYKCDSVMVAQCYREVLESNKFRNGQLRKVVFAIAYNEVKLNVFRECIDS